MSTEQEQASNDVWLTKQDMIDIEAYPNGEVENWTEDDWGGTNYNALLNDRYGPPSQHCGEEAEKRIRKDERDKMFVEAYLQNAGADYVTDHEAMKQQLATAKARIADLEKDRERLDWILADNEPYLIDYRRLIPIRIQDRDELDAAMEDDR